MKKVTEKSTKQEVMALMEPLISDWFRAKFAGLTEPQSYAIPLIHKRKNVLVSSPTGSGKTLTAFLSILNELFKYAKEGRLEDRIYAVYVSPLKALANDINRNLKEPLREMKELAEEQGKEFPEIRVAVRSGDTSQYERQKMLKKPPHIFITTPESLGLVLAAPKFRKKFRQVEWAIIDEIHDICDSKRGVFLSLNMERLQEYCENTPVRVGLSATLAPIDRIAHFLSGLQDGRPREVNLIQAGYEKDLDMRVISPTQDMTALPYEIVNSKMYDTLKELVEQHTTTLIFTNTRSATESVVFKLKERGQESIEAHHGSLSKDTRLEVEERLKAGDLKCVVSSTSLELGIDIGSIDLVCQIGSPKSVAKGLQRVGRSGHGYMQTAKGRMLVLDKDDLVECAVLSRSAHQGKVDRVSIPENCLDVLAQSLVGMAVERKWGVDEALKVVRRSYCYRDLSREKFMDVLRYLGGKDAFEGVYSKVWLDEEDGMFGRRRSSRMIYFLNIGTIPDEANYRVFTEKGAMVGDLSEKFVERLATKDVFVLGGRSYEFRGVKGMKVFVQEASGKKPTVPSWTGEMLPRSFDLSMDIARFRRKLASRLGEDHEELMGWLCEDYDIDRGAARSVISYFQEQRSACDLIPDDRTLAIEGYHDKSSTYNIIFHFPFGRRVNAALSRAYAFQITKEFGCNASISVTDDAFMINTPKKVPLDSIGGMVSSSQLENILRKAVKDSELFKQRFRHVASRSFMILRNYKGKEVSVNRQQVRSGYLLNTLADIEGMPVIEETYREILRDVLDTENAALVLNMVEEGETEIATIGYSSTPSPFAHQIVLTGISDLVMMEDRSALLRELHRKVLSKVMGDSLDEFEFEEEKVTSYFRKKIGSVERKEDIPSLLSRTGPLRIFKEKGRNIYPYASASKEEVDTWALELLREDEIESVYLDGFYFASSEDVPRYSTVLKRDRSIGELEGRVLSKLEEGMTVRRLSMNLSTPSEKVYPAVRKLESMFLVKRVDLEEGRWVFATRECPETNRKEALDHAILHFLGYFAPATAEEIAFSLTLDEEEVNAGLDQLKDEGLVSEGYYIVSEDTQYMLSKDYLRLKYDTPDLFDHATVSNYRRRKQRRSFGNIQECIRFFGQAGSPLDVYSRVKGFSYKEWERLRREGKILNGRFVRGRVRYVLAEDVPMYVAAYQNHSLNEQEEKILAMLESHHGLTTREISKMVDLSKSDVKDIIKRLDRNLYLVRKMNGQENWSSENIYVPLHTEDHRGDAKKDIVERFIRAYGPLPFYSLRSKTRFTTKEIRTAIDQLEVDTVNVGKEGTMMYMMADERENLEQIIPSMDRLQICSLNDPLVQPLWAEISSRYGDRWVYPIVSSGRMVGAIEKWNMSGYIEVRSLDIDDEGLLPDVLDALDRIRPFFEMIGFDIIRVKGVNDTEVEEMPPEMMEVFRSNGYRFIGPTLAKGNLVPDSYSWKLIMAYVFKRQRIAPGDNYNSVLEAIKNTLGFRSDQEAFLRSRVKTPLADLLEQRLIVKIKGWPYTICTDLATAKLTRKAKDHEITRDMETVFSIVKSTAPATRERVCELSPMGTERTRRALRDLYNGTLVFRDHRGLYYPVTDPGIAPYDAKREIVRILFRTFGIFSAENLYEFLKGEVLMSELRDILSELVEEGTLVKGFLNRGDDSVYWMFGADREVIGQKFQEEFVLTTKDSLYTYLHPWIKEHHIPWKYYVFSGPELVGSFEGKVRGKNLEIEEFDGGRLARRIINSHVKRTGLTLRSEDSTRIPEWEIQAFYEKTHPGEA